MQIIDNRTPAQNFNLQAGTSSVTIANGKVVEVEGHPGQFIKVPNKGDLRQSCSRRFLNLDTGQVLQVSPNHACRVVNASLTVNS